jgi:hypothetical protein
VKDVQSPGIVDSFRQVRLVLVDGEAYIYLLKLNLFVSSPEWPLAVGGQSKVSRYVYKALRGKYGRGSPY